MSPRHVDRHLSDFIDGDLPAGEARAVAAHLAACRRCAGRLRTLTAASGLLAELPRVAPAERVAPAVRDRLALERRGPGLALLFRPALAARPMMLPSLVPAVLAVTLLFVVVLGPRAGGPDSPRGPGPSPRLGTEAQPFFPSDGVSAPQLRESAAWPDAAVRGGEGSLFLETVVARDGSVSAVRVLDGDRELAGPVVAALTRERFEPGRFRGRPVAVSVYRLISRMDVRLDN